MLQASSGPGEMGKAVVINNPDPETKAKIDMGWRNNAFNQLVKLILSSSPDLLNVSTITTSGCVKLSWLA